MMKPTRRIKAKDVIHDIRSGMNVSDLMVKYRFTINGMRKAFQLLVKGGAMSTDELNKLKSLHGVSVQGLRQFPRYPVKLPMKIFDGGDPFKGGVIRDVSEKGVCVQGIEAEIGEVKNFIVRMGPFGANTTIVFEARCCWFQRNMTSHKASLAGFEITDISSLDSGVFAAFIQA